MADLGADLSALIQRLGGGPASIVGQSLGGMTALWMAENAPDLVDRIVCCCVTARTASPEAWRDRAAGVRPSGTESIHDLVLQRWGYADRRPDLADWILEQLDATPDEGYAAACEAIADMDLEPELGAIRAPTLVVAGEMDPAAPPAAAAQIAAAIPAGRAVTVADSAHLLEPRTAGRIQRAVAGTPRRGRGRNRDNVRMTDERLERGMRIRREVLGDDHVDRSIARTTEFTRPFQDYVTANVWPEIWGRPGLDRRTRSAVTLAVLTALRSESEIPMHVRAALRNGLTPAEISEVLLHVAAYAGVPAANRAFELANAVLEGEEPPDPVESPEDGDGGPGDAQDAAEF